MCGRYTLTAAPGRVAEQFDLPASEAAKLRPRYNVAPGQDVPAVVRAVDGRALASLHWGILASPAPGSARSPAPINARIESASDIVPFRDAMLTARCLVPADGFFEWRRRTGGPEPHWISLPERALFAFAGLRESVEMQGVRRACVAILTRPARGRLRELHDRMPVLLSPDDYAAWLDTDHVGAQTAIGLCSSPLSDALSFRPVDPRVNDVHFDDPACLDPSPQLAWF